MILLSFLIIFKIKGNEKTNFNAPQVMWIEIIDFDIVQVTPFWLDDMYLLNPIALPINSSPFYLFPRQQFRTSTDQLRLASEIIQFTYGYKIRIERFDSN